MAITTSGGQDYVDPKIDMHNQEFHDFTQKTSDQNFTNAMREAENKTNANQINQDKKNATLIQG